MVTEEDIRIHVRAFAEKGVISKYAVPHAVRLIEAIDKTSVGKCDKKLLRKKYG
jgi:fatty-acyl-CoA synthase